MTKEVDVNNDLDKAISTLNDDTISFINLSSNFKNHELFVSKLNTIQGLQWKATSYSQFKNKSIMELNRMAGTKRNRGYVKSVQSNVNDLPKNFTKWIDEGYVPEPIQQGNCGSC